MMRIVASFLLFTITATIADAHDKAQHHGKPTVGVIAAIDGDHLTLEMDGHQTTVVVNAETKVEDGDKTAGRDRLTKGSSIAVFGTKLPTGELVAHEIHLQGGDDAAHPAAPMDTGSHGHDGRH